MAKKILFSPIGGNDPVSSDTEADGSMLHICRHFQPDIVYLYLSDEMVGRHRKDDRYRYCINKLGKLLDHNFEVKCIERPNLVNVYDYDYYYKDFQNIIRSIEGIMSPGDELLLNIASGTPAMKSELLISAALSEFRAVPIQVTTPAKSINSHKGKDEDYDPEYYWEINVDNNPNAENRCLLVTCPNLVTVLKKNIISRHLMSCDYSAAYSLTQEIRNELPEKTFYAIETALSRQLLDMRSVQKLSKKYGFDFLPVKSSDQAMVFEYILSMGIKLKRKEYGDLVRSISPALTDLFSIILKVQCQISIDEFCYQDKKGLKWDERKLKNSEKGKEILNVFNKYCQDNYQSDFKFSYVAASNLEPLLLYYLQDDGWKELVEEIRLVESKVRNMAAHEIVSIDDRKIADLTGKKYITMNRIYEDMKRLAVIAKIPVRSGDWDSYQKMNEKICEMLLQ